MNKSFKEFFQQFMKDTEEAWKSRILNPNTWGYQIQSGTKWLKGHTQEEIDLVYRALNIDQPYTRSDLHDLLTLTKGLSLPQINLNVQPGQDTYRQDWKLSIDYLLKKWPEQRDQMEEAGEVDAIKNITDVNVILVPIFAHRCVALTQKELKVYSFFGSDDIILYGDNLPEYLVHEFLLD